MATKIQLRRGLAGQWSASNPVLAIAEIGIETDTDQFKVGNGVDRWIDRPYGGIQGPVGLSSALKATTVTLSAGNIAAKSITLNPIPDLAGTVQLTPIGGILQVNGIDYVVNGGTLSWDGMGLDGFLEESELLQIVYQ